MIHLRKNWTERNKGHGIKNVTCVQTMRVENISSDAFIDAKVTSASEPAVFFQMPM